MRRVFGVAAMIGLVLAEMLAVAGSFGVDIADRWLVWLIVFSLSEFGIAMLSMAATFRADKRFMVPREVTAGGAVIALVMVLAAFAPGHLEEGRPSRTATGYVAKDDHGAVLRQLSAEEFHSAQSAENRLGCAVMAVFLYVAALRLLVPARVWSLRRERRWGDLVGVNRHIGGVDLSS